ncbi:MAG: DUF1772 domain-containing protein [Bacteroidota bacterium]|nr:DUF1772 domain-containing protein [Bacteroidota bacterium]
MLTAANIVLIITATACALIAGLFFAYSCSVNLGLGRLHNAEYLKAMKSINKAILNPIFFLTFFGTAVLLPLSTILHYEHPISTPFLFLLVASILYLTGVMGITIFGNVPLNNSLDEFNLQSASEKEISSTRAKFEVPWNNLNLIRTIVSAVSLILIIIACLSK